jgi:hypothetical protein
VISISRRPLSVASFADMALFAAFCIISMLMAVSVQLGPYGTGSATALVPALEFAAITTVVGTMFGLFRAGEKKPLSIVVTRTMLSLAVAVPISYVLFTLVPSKEAARCRSTICSNAGSAAFRCPTSRRSTSARGARFRWSH